MQQSRNRYVALIASISLFTFSNDVAAGAPRATKITFKSGGNSLVGFLYQPEGEGPWPALIWNHGSEKNPAAGPQFDTVASVFVPAGYVVFAPQRRGHGESGGDYIVDRAKFTFKMLGKDEASRLTVRLLETEQLQDQLAGFEYVKQLPFVDAQRIVAAGCSFGGIETLLGAETASYKAAVSISPAALSWDQNDYLRKRMIQGVRRISIPVMLIQPAKDASLGPSHVLGAEAARLGKPLTAKVYPAVGPSKEQSHCFGGADGMHVWADDAKEFFRAAMASD